MKQAKRLTLKMKKILKDNSIDHEKYLYIKNTNKQIMLVNTETGVIISVFK